MTTTRRKRHFSVDRRTSNRRKKTVKTLSQEKRKHQDRRVVHARRSVAERRRHKRFPVITETVRPVEFTIFPSDIKETVPGIITQLSPGGLAMVTFVPLQIGTSMYLTINLPHFKVNMLEGKVVRVEEKGGSYIAGIHFNHIKPDDRAKLNHMSLDYSDCELKLSFGITDVCSKDCRFYPLCEKPQKL